MSSRTYYEKYMRLALAQAMEAQTLGEVPIGAIIVKDGEIIATGCNRRESAQNALLHAETEAIDRACQKLGRWRLSDCELYVTLEPCPMCAGAIINSRLGKVIYGASDPKGGACGSLIDLFACPFNHEPVVISGVLEEECSALLKRFFEGLRT